MNQKETSHVVLLIDYDNMAISVEQFLKGKRFDVSKVMDSLRPRGRIIVKRAYADWRKWGYAQSNLISNAIDMVHLPMHGGSNKNMADIRIAVDALEIAYQNPLIDTFVILSGDSDFSGLVTKLRENGKYVITIGVREATSDLLIFNSDEFISYESLVGISGARDLNEGYGLLKKAMEKYPDEELVRLSSIKGNMLQLDPSFNEKEFGFRQFKDFVLSAEKEGFIRIERSSKGELQLEAVPDVPQKNTRKKSGRKKAAKK